MRQRILIATMLCVLCPAAWSQTGADPACQLTQLADLQVVVTPGGAVLIPATVANQEVWFFGGVESGFPEIFESAVSRLGLKEQLINSRVQTGSRTQRVGSGISTQKGEAVEKKVLLNPFVIGRLGVANWAGAVNADPGGPLPDYQGRPIIGVLGSQLFQLVDVELDLANSRIRLFKASECKGAPVYWGGEYTATPIRFDPFGAMSFTMELDGHKIETTLMNGARASSIDEGIAKQYFGVDRNTPELQDAGGNGEPAAGYRAMSLTTAGLDIRNAPVRLMDSRVPHCGASRSAGKGDSIGYAQCINVTPFSLGTDLLQKLRIYSAVKQMKLYITRSDSAPAQSSLRTGSVDGSR